MKQQRSRALNPKMSGSGLIDAVPQAGPCPQNCNQCYYNRPGAWFAGDPALPYLPSLQDAKGKIVRVNSGHDSNLDRDLVFHATAIYEHRFFNTSIPRFDFPGPVVFTANRHEEQPATLPRACGVPDNLMYVRLRVSTTNLCHIDTAVQAWAGRRIPVSLTFMAYYEYQPEESDAVVAAVGGPCYIWRQRHLNAYWCPTAALKRYVIAREKLLGGRLVFVCGGFESPYCRDCRMCEAFYWITLKHMRETTAAVTGKEEAAG